MENPGHDHASKKAEMGITAPTTGGFLSRPACMARAREIGNLYSQSPLKTMWDKYGCYVPIFNIMFAPDSETPSFNDVTKLLEIMALVNALMLTWVVTLPSAVDYDHLVAADDRFIDHNEYMQFADCISWYTPQEDHALPSNRYATVSSLAYTSLLTNTLMVLYTVVYLSLTVDPDGIHSQADITLWWSYGRYWILLLMLMTSVGFIMSADVLDVQLLITFPDYHLLDTPFECPGSFTSPVPSSSWQVFRYNLNWLAFSQWPALGILSFMYGKVTNAKRKRQQQARSTSAPAQGDGGGSHSTAVL
jgi:hypothetical protein